MVEKREVGKFDGRGRGKWWGRKRLGSDRRDEGSGREGRRGGVMGWEGVIVCFPYNPLVLTPGHPLGTP